MCILCKAADVVKGCVLCVIVFTDGLCLHLVYVTSHCRRLMLSVLNMNRDWLNLTFLLKSYFFLVLAKILSGNIRHKADYQSHIFDLNRSILKSVCESLNPFQLNYCVWTWFADDEYEATCCFFPALFSLSQWDEPFVADAVAVPVEGRELNLIHRWWFYRRNAHWPSD